MRYLLTVLLLIILCVPAFAGEFNGSISLQTPVRTPDFFPDDSPALLLDLNLPLQSFPLKVWVNAEHRLKDDCFQDFDNKIRVGGDIPLTSGLTLYSFWERRYSLNLNRIMVGCRLNFKGCY